MATLRHSLFPSQWSCRQIGSQTWGRRIPDGEMENASVVQLDTDGWTVLVDLAPAVPNRYLETWGQGAAEGIAGYGSLRRLWQLRVDGT